VFVLGTRCAGVNKGGRVKKHGQPSEDFRLPIFGIRGKSVYYFMN
jgi:hypothetical protein